MDKLLFEVACGNIEDIILCEKHGVERIELNLALAIGGLTPSIGLAKKTRELYSGKVIAMLRPRAGGFIYSKEELEVMKEDAEALYPYVDGYVFGCVNKDATIDINMLKEVKTWCKDKELVFHRAFDLVEDAFVSIEELISCGVDRVLTSGLGYDVPAGIDTLKLLNKKYGEKIEILAGGGILTSNILDLAEKTGLNQFHGSLRTTSFSLDTNGEVSYSYLKEKNAYDHLSEEQLVELLNKIR